MEKFADEIGVKLEKVDPDFFGDFASAGFHLGDRIVRYSTQLESDPEKLLYVVAHELGHAIDLETMTEEEKIDFKESAGFFNDCVALESEFPEEVRDFVLSSEKIACEFAELLLDELGIAYGRKRAKKVRRQMMLAYRLMFE